VAAHTGASIDIAGKRASASRRRSAVRVRDWGVSARRLHRVFDRELWEVDGALWCVLRPRTFSVAAIAAWATVGAAAALVALACALAIVLADEGGGFWAWTIAGAAIALLALVRGRRAWGADRTLRARPIADLPHVIVERDRLREPDGVVTPLAEVRLTRAEVDHGETTRHELTLAWRDRQLVVFHAARAHGLEPVIDTLARAGLSVAPPAGR
jgi:hypothetical protein